MHRMRRIWIGLALAALAGAARADMVADCEADGDWEAKRAACSAAIESGTWSGPELAWAYNNRGVAQNLLGLHATAEQDFDEALRLLPDFPPALSGRAQARCRLGEFERSVEDRLRAMELGGFTPTALQDLLKAQGFYGGTIDGQFGSGSRAGLLAWTKAGCPGVE